METPISLTKFDDDNIRRGTKIVYSHCEIKTVDGTWFLDVYNDSTFILKYQKLSTMTTANWKVTVATGKIGDKPDLCVIEGQSVPVAELKVIQSILTALLPKKEEP